MLPSFFCAFSSWNAAPEGSVQNMALTLQSGTSLIISWEKPPANTLHGSLTRFQIGVTHSILSGVHQVLHNSLQEAVTDQTITQYSKRLEGRAYGSQYTLSISACRLSLCGPHVQMSINTSVGGKYKNQSMHSGYKSNVIL